MTNERIIDKKVLLIVNPKAGRAKLKSKADGSMFDAGPQPGLPV